MKYDIYEELLKIKTKNDSYNILKDYYNHIGKKPKKNEKFNILLLNAPCNGFGDVIFAMKLSKYLKNWYPNSSIKIATPKIDNFLSLGEDPNNLYFLNPNNTNKGLDQCRRFSHLKIQSINKQDIEIPIFDIIIVAPIQMDFYPNISDVAKIIPYANNINTLTFSEYNDEIDKNFDFNTGIGDNRDGLLFTFPEKIGSKLPSLKNPYAVIYIHDLDNSHKCFLSFIKLLTYKYSKKHKKLDIVLPSWITDLILNDEKFQKKMFKVLNNYENVQVKNKDETISIIQNNDNKYILTFRNDILPLPNKDMLRLYKYSINDILITGDQSLTDVLSCCSENKILHYQIVAWKIDFAKNLSKYLPDKYIGKNTTSCGTIQQINYKTDFKKFIKDWDFRKISKDRLSAYLQLSLDIKKEGHYIKELYDIIKNSKTYKEIINKIR